MKNQALFSSKDKSKKLKCCLLQFLFGALRVKTNSFPEDSCEHSDPLVKVVIITNLEQKQKSA